MIEATSKRGRDAAGEATAKSIFEKVWKARERIAARDVNGSVFQTALAEVELQGIIHRRGLGWRLRHIHQASLFVYHFIAFAVFIQLSAGNLDRWIVSELLPVGVPIEILAVGGLGAVARGIWFLWFHVSRQLFRTHFTLAHLSAPVLGALFGLLSYLLLRAGVVVLEGSPDGEIEKAALPYALAFLAGYSWEWILGRLDSLKSRTAAPGSPGSAGPGQGTENRGGSAEGADGQEQGREAAEPAAPDDNEERASDDDEELESEEDEEEEDAPRSP